MPPLALTDAQMTSVMQLARPLSPDQRAAFLEMIASKLNGRTEIGDGALFRLCATLQQQVFTPPLQTERHEPRHDRTRVV